MASLDPFSMKPGDNEPRARAISSPASVPNGSVTASSPAASARANCDNPVLNSGSLSGNPTRDPPQSGASEDLGSDGTLTEAIPGMLSLAGKVVLLARGVVSGAKRSDSCGT